MGNMTIRPGLCILLSLMLLMLPIQWIFAAVCAAAFHELCHAAAVVLCGGRVKGLTLGFHGAKLTVSVLTPGKELLCVLAGPVGGFILLLTARWFPRLALCAAFHSLYNLLPINPMDGGRVLRCVCAIFLPAHERIICLWIERIFLFSISALAVYGSFVLKLGLFPLLIAAFMWANGKIHLANRRF